MSGQDKGWHVGEELRSGLWFKKVAYLLLSLPLGILYFVLLVVGVSLGLGLVIVLVGIPILAGVLAACAALGRFERVLNGALLEIPVPVTKRKDPFQEPGLIARLKRLLSDPFVWTSMVYLFLKFPFGLIGFTLTITLVTVSLALVLMPLFFGMMPVNFDGRYWSVDTLEGALLASLAGLVLAGATIFVLSGLATLWGHFGRFMLRERGAAARVQPDSHPVVIE
jgi:hypothetical protein